MGTNRGPIWFLLKRLWITHNHRVVCPPFRKCHIRFCYLSTGLVKSYINVAYALLGGEGGDGGKGDERRVERGTDCPNHFFAPISAPIFRQFFQHVKHDLNKLAKSWRINWATSAGPLCLCFGNLIHTLFTPPKMSQYLGAGCVFQILAQVLAHVLAQVLAQVLASHTGPLNWRHTASTIN